jgi:hypothetical protein
MIAALCMLLQGGKTDVEVVPPVSPGVISVEAIMRLPKTGPRERAELEVIAATLLDDTEEYGHRQLVKLTVMSGETIRCDLYPDCMRVRFGVLESDVASAVPILANVVHAAELHEEALNASMESLMFQRRDYWASALEPEALRFRDAHVPDIMTLYKVMGKPENLTITFAAPAATGADLLDRWRTTVDAWDHVPTGAFPPDSSIPRPTFHRRGKLTTILLRGASVDPKAPSFATNLLAIFALGGGKDSAVWKSLREGLGWSYRQEAMLRNSVVGLEPVVETVTEHSEADIERSLQVRPELEKAIAHWTEEDKKHAIASAEALFNRGLGLDPIYFKSTRPSSEDALFMRTYWRFKTGEEWAPARLLASMESVDLKSLQAAATAILDGAGIEVIQGSG